MDRVTDPGGETDYHRLRWLNPTQVLEARMLWLAVILVVAWALGWGVFHVAGGLIHLLLVVALVVFLFNFISGRRTV